MVTEYPEQRLELRSLDIMSLARFLAVFQSLLMLASGILLAVVSDYTSEGRAMTFVPVLVQIALNALGGFILGLIFGVVYNAVATVLGLRLTVRRVTVPEAEEEEATAEPRGVPGVRVGPHPAAGAPVDRQAARRQEKAAFAKAAATGAVVLLGLVWLVLLMPMEGAYRECKDLSSEGSPGTVNTHFRCLQASARGKAYGFLYPIKRGRMRQWGQAAELRVAESLSQLNYPLAAAAYATRYLHHPADQTGRQRAQAVVDYAKWQGFGAEEITAAARIRAKLTKFHVKDTLGDTELYFDYRLANGSGRRLKPVSCAWLIAPVGKQGFLEVTELTPGQAVSERVSFTLPMGTGNFGSKDIMILPVRACPVK